MTRSISTADTAKCIRKALKLAWPTVKFSVRCQRGGAIYISWVDGPTSEDLDHYVSAYSSSGFDGTIDMSYCKTSWLLPDGRAFKRSSQGTTGSRGYAEPYKEAQPSPDAEAVSFGSDYIFTSRALSDKYKESAIRIYSNLSNELKCRLYNTGVVRDTWNYSDGTNDDEKCGTLYAYNNGLRISNEAQEINTH